MANHLQQFKALLLLFVLASVLDTYNSARAQTRSDVWSPPLNLFETAGRASEAKVVTDATGTVHVFWAYGAPDAEEEGWGQAIYYARRQDGTWSKPVDVLISPGGRTARMHSVAEDTSGYLHVVWSGGSALFYSRAHSSDAGMAAGWSAPEALAANVLVLEPSVAVGPDNSLSAVWTQGGTGLVFSRSLDGGQSWSTPKVIFEAALSTEMARWPNVAVDELGHVHVVLTHELSTDKNDPNPHVNSPMYLYYLRSDDSGESWSEPFLITPEPDFGQINVATFGKNSVHLVWNGRAGRRGRYHRWSLDGGLTWSDTVEIISPESSAGVGGLTGNPALVVDSTGVLHLVTTSSPDNFYVRWRDGVWSAPALISPGLDGKGVTGMGGGSLEQPSIALSEGNRLHVVFHDGFERIWYTEATIDAPYQPPIALATAAPEVEPSATASISPTSLPTTVTPELARTPQPRAQSPMSPLLAGLIPAALLVSAAVLLSGLRRRR